MQTWPMRPLLETDAGEPITDADGWAARAAQIRRTFAATLGPTPPSQSLRGFELGDRAESDGVARTLVRIELDVDDTMEAWLLEPADGPAPTRVAIAFHPTNTTDPGKDQTAGLTRDEYKPYGAELARRGWAVLVPDQLAVPARWAKGLKAYDTARFYERFPDWSAVGKMVFDGRACLDVLEQIPRTAGRPVSLVGHSLGGQTSLYVAAMDERPVAVVNNCGTAPFADAAQRAHWFRDHWYIYFRDPALKRSVVEGPVPLWDFHELAALVAPRRLWLAMAPNDPIVMAVDGPVRMVGELHELWRMLGTEGALTCLLHDEGHAFTPGHRALAWAWLEAPGDP